MRFGTSYLHMYITELNHKRCWFMTHMHPLEFAENSITFCSSWGHEAPLSLTLFYNWTKRSLSTQARGLGFLAAALWFACELLICLLLIEITVGSARPVTVRSWHSGTQPEWILQSSKSACQEIGHKGNNCQLNQIAWSKLDKFC